MKKTPKEAGFFMPAEWHRHAGCWMAWPSREATWESIGLKRAKVAYTKVAKAIARFEKVFMLVNPADKREAAEHLGAEIALVEAPLDDSWTRDIGPTFLLNQAGQLAGVDWIHNAWGGKYQPCTQDNAIASFIMKRQGAMSFHAPLVMEGGALHVDGEGTLLTTRECLLHPNRNPSLSEDAISTYLQDYLNIQKIIWLNQGLVGDETDGHVDEIACFIAPTVVLALITKDKSDPNYARLQANLSILEQARDAKGRSFTVHTVEQPPATYLAQRRLTLSYINFYRANQGIVMPAFGHPAYDEAAFLLLKRLVPDSEINQVEALDIFAGGGGIHCITQQQPI